MIRQQLVKWVSAGALALGTIPAVGWAHHSSHVSAAGVTKSVAKTPVLAAERKSTTTTPTATTKHKKHKALGKHHRRHHHKSKKKTS